ncbi:MAG: UDP-N-acetylglucosamine 2-epimerase (non-hydrolyzing) [Saprospiraceae bacterium]|nr:UDP-N-acetylglucosamine 2-epimerase (non-hydrolyzing) [Saprospiraceae bacterium]
MKIISIVGARPNFMKVAPIHRAFNRTPDKIISKIIHTGQHFDEKMSQIFFDELELPVPDYFLGVGQGTHTEVTARIMLDLEPIFQNEKPDLVLVVGDVTSTFAAAIVAQRNGIKVAHVEAGLRSFDRGMPEEINRLLTDQISDYLFITEESGMINLAKENIPQEKIFFVGNCMIDSLAYYTDKTSNTQHLAKYGIESKDYIIMTMHRPSNVDHEQGLINIISIIKEIGKRKKIVFPVHPRTSNKLESMGLMEELKSLNIILTEPLAYLEFVTLMRYSSLILTDSGGVQEETTYLGIPCVTFRKTTERPVTVDLGTNILMDDLNVEKTIQTVNSILDGHGKKGTIPPYWDGNAAIRIRDILIQEFYS